MRQARPREMQLLSLLHQVSAVGRQEARLGMSPEGASWRCYVLLAALGTSQPSQNRRWYEASRREDSQLISYLLVVAVSSSSSASSVGGFRCLLLSLFYLLGATCAEDVCCWFFGFIVFYVLLSTCLAPLALRMSVAGSLVSLGSYLR